MSTLAPSFFDSIFFILAGIENMNKCLNELNKDSCKVSDEFEIRLDPTMDCIVSCP